MATILCDSLIDASCYQDVYMQQDSTYFYHYYDANDSTKNIYANNYEHSTIREWLNDSFYKGAESLSTDQNYTK